MPFGIRVASALPLLLLCAMACAQSGGPRTLAELKADVQERADRHAYPVSELEPAEVKEALASLKTLDRDEWVRVTHEEAARIVAAALVNIATTYSGEKGKELLLKQGYEPEMVEATKGAGTQVMKFRGGMPLLGITRATLRKRVEKFNIKRELNIQ